MRYTAFSQLRKVAAGSRTEVVAFLQDRPQGEVLVFDDETGAQVDLDTRGTGEELARGYPDAAPAEPRGRGRPRLGVIAKEVTLLPRHWDWLSSQPGGASVALRRLVDEARRADGGETEARAAREAAYRFMSAIAGNLPGFEEASRALFAGDRDRFVMQMAKWPADLRIHAERLAFGEATSAGAQAKP